MSVERRKLSEIITRYLIEPNLFGDIYVEGTFDKRLLDWFFREIGCSSAVVYVIDTVDIPEEVLQKYQLSSSNRNRVIALAHELAREVNTIQGQAKFIIDQDLEKYIPSKKLPDILTLTDFTSTELYLFEERILRRFLPFSARRPEIDATQFIRNISHVLRQLFLVRLANASLISNMSSVSFKESCLLSSSGEITLDLQHYLKRYLQKNGKMKDLQKITVEMQMHESNLLSDARHWIHGHDLISLLYWFCNHSPGKKHFQTEEGIVAALLMSLDIATLREFELFKSLESWISSKL